MLIHSDYLPQIAHLPVHKDKGVYCHELFFKEKISEKNGSVNGQLVSI